MGESLSQNMELHLFQAVEGPSISGLEISSLGTVARHLRLHSELQTSRDPGLDPVSNNNKTKQQQ